MTIGRIVEPLDLQRILRPRVEEGQGCRVSTYDKKAKKMIELFDCIGPLPGEVVWNVEQAGNVARDSCERLGLLQVSTEFHPSSESKGIAQDAGVELNDQNVNMWKKGFTRITEGAHLLPDTDILIARTLSSIILPRFGDDPKSSPFILVLPRFGILELEKLANAKESREKLAKGICFMAFNEVRMLKEKGAMLTPPLEPEDRRSFYRSIDTADSFIREEVRKFHAGRHRIAGKRARTVFLTGDMISALSASAEDIDTIYMHLRDPDQTRTEQVGMEDLGRLLIEVATAQGEILLRWSGESKHQRIQGVWSGKDWYDYYKRRIKVFDEI